MNHSAPSTDSTDNADRLVHWLIDSVQLEATVFHLGQYCGRWQASTAGRGLGSFHLALHGECYLHVEGRAPVHLRARDGVFLLRDTPHFLSPDADPATARPGVPMQPLGAAAPDATALACGFFHFRSALSTLIADSFPDSLVLRADEPALRALNALFDLILLEPPRDPEAPSPLVARLAELMFFYAIRHAARQQDIATGLLAVASRPEFSPLLDRMMQEPGQDWSTENMARAAHMSRSSFYKHFSEASGQAPAQFLLLLRMKIAAQRLHGGDTVERTAGHVGYNSYAAFSRAFHKVMGEHPGRFRRGRHVPVKTSHASPIRTIEQKTRTGVSGRVFGSPLK
ncbi:AraC family transcriptional regulator [Telluria beijingensis]|uniref:AraC family transcriptional regulator n=1 Tax=Telluria beijingensis TaxID=3068633 RepID=UPI0027954498|nr:AraC family transcriptional regulator [Massilia sp. REN29]